MCREGELNPQGAKHRRILSPLWLPVPLVALSQHEQQGRGVPSSSVTRETYWLKRVGCMPKRARIKQEHCSSPGSTGEPAGRSPTSLSAVKSQSVAGARTEHLSIYFPLSLERVKRR